MDFTRIKMTKTSSIAQTSYNLIPLEYTKIHFKNKGLAYSLAYAKSDDERIEKVKNDISKYNEKIELIHSLCDFEDFFEKHDYCLTREQLSKKYSSEIADKLLEEQSYSFNTELIPVNDCLIATNVNDKYEICLEGQKLLLPIGEPAWNYPAMLSDKTIIWNFVDNGHDFCFALWDLLGGKYEPDNSDENYDGVIYYGFDCYDDIRNDEPEPQLVTIMSKLIDLGYISLFTAYSEERNPRLRIYGKSNETIDFAVIDTAFLKNQELLTGLYELMWGK